MEWWQQPPAQPGEVLVFPTETFYAIGCLATDSVAVKRIYQIKGRSLLQPLLVLCCDWEMLQRYSQPLSLPQQRFLLQHWPGPLTVLIQAHHLASELNQNSPWIGFRIPGAELTRKLIQTLGAPLVGTSANLSGKPPSINIEMAKAAFGTQVDRYLDGGNTPGGQPSTLIRFVDEDQFEVLRQGAIAFSSNRF